MLDLGREVRRRRKQLGWSLEVLAERSSLSPHYLSTVETGTRDPSLSTIIAIAKAFDVPPGRLLGQVKGLSPRAQQAAQLFDCVPERVQEAVLAILEAWPDKTA